METATLAGGCFWCTEAIFKRLKGVKSVVPGYSGGNTDKPSYGEVSSGKSNHAESIQIKFDPKKISYEKLLEIFFNLHDPTTLNRQGNDIGTQYRSAIFYHNDKQKETAEKLIEKLNQKAFGGKIVTELNPYSNFYEAEDYHKEYYEKNKDLESLRPDGLKAAGYCRVVIDPKITKLYKDFGNEVKEEYKQ